VGALKTVEIGTLGGYSGVCLLRGMGPHGVLHTFEYSEKHARVAAESFRKAGVASRAHIHVGPALQMLREIEAEAPFDLVFIDAPLCGFSRAVGKGTAKDFAGTDQDIRAFEKFIVRYLTVNQRWNSPKFLFGESYGTTRSAGLVAALQNDGIEFNGVTLLSSILNYNRRNPGLDYEAVGYIPSFAAIAYHYKKVKTSVSMAEWVQQARVFARGPYSEALQQGDKLPAAEFDAMAVKLAAITGLSGFSLFEAPTHAAAETSSGSSASRTQSFFIQSSPRGDLS